MWEEKRCLGLLPCSLGMRLRVVVERTILVELTPSASSDAAASA